MMCPGCNNVNAAAETYWKIFGDPPELCAQDHRPPRWAQYTKCCEVRVGEIHDGYSPPGGGAGVAPRIGF